MGWESSRRTHARLLAGLAAAVAVLVPTGAVAHTGLVSSNPKDGQVVDIAPDHIVLEFVDPVAADDSSVSVLGPDGDDWAAGVLRSSSGRLVSVVLDPGGPSGSWQVRYRVRGDDGHLVAGRLDYTVGEPSGIVGQLGLAPLSAGALIVLVAAAGYLVLAPRLVRDLEGVR